MVKINKNGQLYCDDMKKGNYSQTINKAILIIHKKIVEE